MKTIIKIAIALALLVACVNFGRATFANYQFEDDIHNGLLFNPRATEQQIVEMVMKAASDYELDVDPSNIEVTSNKQDLNVAITYTTNIALIPGVWGMDWTFTPKASTKFLPGASR